MSAPGSKRVKVVHRKFIALRVARAASSERMTSGQPAKTGSRASRAAAAGSDAYGGPEMTRHPPQKTAAAVTPAGSAGLEKSRGNSRTGSPSPSQTPFDP